MENLVNDNIPKLIHGTYRRCKDDKEFFTLLQDKVRRNLDKLFATPDIDKKYNAVYDLLTDLGVIKGFIDTRYKSPVDRGQQIGGYNYRYIQEEEEIIINRSEIQKVRDWAEKNEWPELVLKDRIIERGKDSWDNICSLAELNEPYRDVFKDVIREIRKT